jgi:uncharacterized protein involved in exopolysaccharide biosynthesis
MYQNPDSQSLVAATKTVAASKTDFDQGNTLTTLTDVGFRLWRGKWLIILSMVLSASCASLYLSAAPPRYTAAIQLLIDATDLQVLENPLQSQTQLNDSAVIANVENQLQILTSSGVLLRVIETQQLNQDEEFTTGLMRDGFPADSSTLTALRNLSRQVNAKRTERSYIVTLEVTTRQREKSVRIANAIVEAFHEEQAKSQQATVRRVTETLNEQLATLKQQVAAAEQRVADFKQQNLASSLTDQLTTLKQQVVVAEQRIADFRQQSGSPQAGLSGRVSIALQPSARDGAKLDDSGNQSRDQLAAAKDLDEVVDNARKLTNDNKRALDLGEFEHDLQAIRSIYEKYQMRALELTARQKLDMTNFRVISPALSIGPRSWPPPALVVVAAASLLGALLGSVVVYLRQAMVLRSRREL